MRYGKAYGAVTGWTPPEFAVSSGSSVITERPTRQASRPLSHLNANATVSRGKQHAESADRGATLHPCSDGLADSAYCGTPYTTLALQF